MSAHKETAPTRREGRSQSKDQPKPSVSGSVGARRNVGCIAGCELAPWPKRTIHTCGIGEPLAELPPADHLQRAGRDLEMQERDRLGLLWLVADGAA